jgi:hypothetical protein
MGFFERLFGQKKSAAGQRRDSGTRRYCVLVDESRGNAVILGEGFLPSEHDLAALKVWYSSLNDVPHFTFAVSPEPFDSEAFAMPPEFNWQLKDLVQPFSEKVSIPSLRAEIVVL